MRLVLPITLLLLILFQQNAYAQSYPAGTAGFLFEDCKTTLIESQSLKDAHNSYCGAFIEGYVMGLMLTNQGDIPKPNISDPCRIDKERAFTHINNRYCTRFPSITPENTSAGHMIEIIANVIGEWANHNPLLLKRSAVEALEPLLAPGKFCDHINEDMINSKDTALPVNNALKNIGWTDLLSAKGLVSIERKNKQCETDIKNSNGNHRAFKGTKCGGEILGFMAGLRSSNHLQKTRIKSTAQATEKCKKPLNRVYDGFNVANTMCVRSHTDPLLIARIFTQNYELIRGKPQKEWGWADLFDAGDLGAVGYETIYRGFLCRNEAELKAAKR